jgi:hypothetical protein
MTDIIKLAREAGMDVDTEANPAVFATVADIERFAELVAAPLRADAERWRYSVAIGGNQTMNWLDVYDDWDGDGDFTDQIDAARAKEQT